jgi:hypothetical protein
MNTEMILNRPVRIYDNGGASADRFTAVYLDEPERAPRVFAARAMDETPFHPLGFGQCTTAICGRHLGRRIAFCALPADCQQLVRQDLGA